MPNYFLEGDAPRPTDSLERSMAKAVSLLPTALDALTIDPDAAAYVALSGATDVANLDAFVKGVKDLGLWESMVCWPLRSSQNAGTGTTAYSLGGLGTFDGTLTNGPTWGADYLSFIPTGARMTASLPTNFSSISAIVAVNTTNSNVVGGILGFGAVPIALTNITDISTGPANNRHLIFGQGSPPPLGLSPRLSAGAHIMAVTMELGGNIVAYEDAATRSTTSLGIAVPTLANFRIGSRFINDEHTANVEHAFVSVFNVTLTSGQYASLRTIYKTTLGTGLSLP